jgi:hypothetical protein
MSSASLHTIAITRTTSSRISTGRLVESYGAALGRVKYVRKVIFCQSFGRNVR